VGHGDEGVPPDAPGPAATGAAKRFGEPLAVDLPLGLRRRAAFAIALAHHPDLLVLDAPTSGVDPLQRARLWETIRASAE
jgi:ABC-2 type transport system ATP-binding protein